MDSNEIQVRDKLVEQRKEIVLKGEQTIAILADSHSNWDYIRWFVKEVLKHPNWKVIINGDLWDVEQYGTFGTMGDIPSLESTVKQMIVELRPIFNQLIAFVWGNHEARAFKEASGKGTMPNPFSLFFQAWQAINPYAIVCELDRSLVLTINTGTVTYHTLLKHGCKAGTSFGIIEFANVLAVNEDLDAIIMSHVHIPLYQPLMRTTENEPRRVHCIRTTAPKGLPPYADRANLFVANGGMTRVHYKHKDIKVELL